MWIFTDCGNALQQPQWLIRAEHPFYEAVCLFGWKALWQAGRLKGIAAALRARRHARPFHLHKCWLLFLLLGTAGTGAGSDPWAYRHQKQKVVGEEAFASKLLPCDNFNKFGVSRKESKPCARHINSDSTCLGKHTLFAQVKQALQLIYSIRTATIMSWK